MGEFVGCIEGMAAGLPGARLPGRLGQRLVLQRDRRPGDLADADDRRPRADRRSRPHGDHRLAQRGPGAGADRRDLRLARLLALSARGLRPRGGRAAAGRSRRPSGAMASWCARCASRAWSRPATTCPTAASTWRWPRWRWPRASAPISSCRTDCESAAAWLFGEDQGRYLLAVAPDRLAAGRGRGRPRRACWRGGSAPPAGPR